MLSARFVVLEAPEVLMIASPMSCTDVFVSPIEAGPFEIIVPANLIKLGLVAIKPPANVI